MALQLSPQCKVCNELKSGNTELLSRLYGSAAYRGRKGEAVTDLVQAYPQFNRWQIMNHTKYHQGLTAADIQKALIKQRDQVEVTELAREAVDANSARQLIIDEGTRRIRSGEAEVEPTHVLQATKQISDIEAKQTDQNILMKQMMIKFMSGEEEYAGPDPRSERDVIDLSDDSAAAPMGV